METATVPAVKAKTYGELEAEQLTPQQQLFCQLYVKNKELFGNGTLCYGEAYGYKLDELDKTRQKDAKGKEIKGSSEFDKAYAVCASEASRTLKKPNVDKYVKGLFLELLNETDVDSELSGIIKQDRSIDGKIRAIQEFNKLRGRLAPEKVEHDVIVEVVHYAISNTKTPDPHTAPVRAEVVPAPDPSQPGTLQSGGSTPQIGQEQNSAQPADSKGDDKAGAVPVSVTDFGASQESNLAGRSDDAALPAGDSSEKK